MKRTIRLILLTLLLIATLGSLSSISLAETNTTGTIDYVVIQRKDKSQVRVNIDNYLGMKYYKRPEALYNNMHDGTGYLNVIAVVSGDKYIKLEQYLAKLYYDNKDNPQKLKSKSIANAKPLTTDEIKDFKTIVIKDNKVQYNLDGTLVIEPISTDPVDPPIEEFRVISIY